MSDNTASNNLHRAPQSAQTKNASFDRYYSHRKNRITPILHLGTIKGE